MRIPGRETSAEAARAGAAEDVTHTLHNLYTLRDAKVRDGLLWSKYLQQALDMFGDDMTVVFASHHWPTPFICKVCSQSDAVANSQKEAAIARRG